jgi:hypothetical protein
MPIMRRCLAILLLVFLPFQFSWAAVAGYCQHETGAAAQHIGHHEHKHHSDGADPSDAKALGGGIDGDCAVCHAGCAAALTGLAVLPLVAASFANHLWHPGVLTSPPTGQPERPNWPVSA